MRTRRSARSISGRRTSRIVRPSITVLTFGWCGRDGGRAPWWTTRTGHLGRDLEDRLQDAGQARASPRPLRGHEHHEIAGREVRAPVEAPGRRARRRARSRPGGPGRCASSRRSRGRPRSPSCLEVPWKSRNRKSVGHTTTRRMGGPSLHPSPGLTDQAPYLVRRRAWARMSGMRSWAGRVPRLPGPAGPLGEALHGIGQARTDRPARRAPGARNGRGGPRGWRGPR